jgi:hypothetical protein
MCIDKFGPAFFAVAGPGNLRLTAITPAYAAHCARRSRIPAHGFCQAARSSSEASSFSGLFTRVETGYMTMRSAGNGTSRSWGSASVPSQRS